MTIEKDTKCKINFSIRSKKMHVVLPPCDQMIFCHLYTTKLQHKNCVVLGGVFAGPWKKIALPNDLKKLCSFITQ